MGARWSGEVGKSSDGSGKLADAPPVLRPVIGNRLNGPEFKRGGDLRAAITPRFHIIKIPRSACPLTPTGSDVRPDALAAR